MICVNRPFQMYLRKKDIFDKVHYGGYRCDVCGKCFTREDNIKRHVELVHEDPKPEFSCSWCNSKFKLHANLVKHRKFGLDDKGEIKYQCKDCQRIFCILIDLQRHRKLKHKSFKCDICEKGF